MVRNVLAALAMIAVLPLSASAKTMLGTLHHGASFIQFVLAGNTLVVEQGNASGPLEAFNVPLKAAACPQLAGNALTIRTRGAQIAHSTTGKAYYDWVFDAKKRGAATFAYDTSEAAEAGALIEKLNVLLGCR